MIHAACGTLVSKVTTAEAIAAITKAGHRDALHWPTLYNCPRCWVYTSDVCDEEKVPR